MFLLVADSPNNRSNVKGMRFLRQSRASESSILSQRPVILLFAYGSCPGEEKLHFFPASASFSFHGVVQSVTVPT